MWMSPLKTHLSSCVTLSSFIRPRSLCRLIICASSCDGQPMSPFVSSSLTENVPELCLLFSFQHHSWSMTDFIKPCKLANSWSISVSYPFTLDSQSILSPDLFKPKICFEVNMKSKLITSTFFFGALFVTVAIWIYLTNLILLSHRVTLYLTVVTFCHILVTLYHTM